MKNIFKFKFLKIFFNCIMEKIMVWEKNFILGKKILEKNIF